VTILHVVTGTVVLPNAGNTYFLEIPQYIAMVQNTGYGQPILVPSMSFVTPTGINDIPDFLFQGWDPGQAPSTPAEVYAQVYRQPFSYTISGGADLTVRLYLTFTDDTLTNPIAYASL